MSRFNRRGSRAGVALRLLAVAVATATLLAAPAASAQDAPQQQTFPSAQQAVEALVAASANNDVAALQQLLGPDAAKLISSGDDTQDRNDRAKFVSLYQTHHRLEPAANGEMTLVVGKNEWPLPIPLMKSDGAWKFDSADGVKELLYLRIGANELAAIKVCHALRQAQLEYAATAHDGNPRGAYAQRFHSKPGTQDGLYWPVTAGEPQSPAGPLVADSEAEGYEQGSRHPFHGYYFRILKAQGPSAHGGARDYVVDGRMTSGFAILAYPAEYGASGVMTFLVSRRGSVYQKDLGESTAEAAKAITTFDPDASWTRLPSAD
jgi:hypothetical protein